MRVRQLIESNLKTYLGIDGDWLSVISLLTSKFKVRGSLTSLDIACLVIRKIRLNETFAVLGHEFGISLSQASRFQMLLAFFRESHERTNCLAK
jgi:hypothetical protein